MNRYVISGYIAKPIKMSKSTIEDIPPEVMCEIFKKLDHITLKTCCLVSPKWNKVISTSPDFLNRTSLVIRTSSLCTEDLSMKPTRNYKNLKISNVPNVPDKMQKLLFITYAPEIDYDTLTKVISNVSPACANLKSFEVTILHRKVNNDVQNLLVKIMEANSHSLEQLVILEKFEKFPYLDLNDFPKLRRVFPEHIMINKCYHSKDLSMQIYDDDLN